MTLQLKQQSQSKEAQFKIMINTFEELYDKKLEPSQVQLWRKFLYDYPQRYFVRVVELAGELKWFPRISEIKDRFYEYSLQEASRSQKLPPPQTNNYHKELGRKWMAQIHTILSYGGLLREDFNNNLLSKLYEPEELKSLLNRNLRAGEKPPY